jgi:hypothetical protein
MTDKCEFCNNCPTDKRLILNWGIYKTLCKVNVEFKETVTIAETETLALFGKVSDFLERCLYELNKSKELTM